MGKDKDFHTVVTPVDGKDVLAMIVRVKGNLHLVVADGVYRRFDEKQQGRLKQVLGALRTIIDAVDKPSDGMAA